DDVRRGEVRSVMLARWRCAGGAALVMTAAALAPGCDRPNDELPEKSPCAADTDCVLVDRGCCTLCDYVTSPGALNPEQEEAWRKRHDTKCLPQTPCPQPTCNFSICYDGYKAVCKAGSCGVEATKKGYGCDGEKPPKAP